MEIYEKIILPPEVINALHSDSIIIFPTETLYGIGCSIVSASAVARVFEIKGRAFDQPPPVLIADKSSLKDLVESIPPSALPLMANFWPGSLTLILPACAELPDALCGSNEKQNKRTVAVRQTAHPLASALCTAQGSPIIATSANFSGAFGQDAQPKTLSDIPLTLQKMVDVVINGGAVGGAPSTIVDCLCEPPRVLRAGAIGLTELQKFSPELQAF